MNKKIWSIILLSLVIAAFVLTVVICVDIGVTAYNAKSNISDASSGEDAIASMLGLMLSSLLSGATALVIGFVASFGWICALINVKIAPVRTVKRISEGFLIFYSAVLLLAFAVFACFLFAIL
ncbi:MAG: hypothetical protein IKJ80_00970 [Clostridia bacterium]|nr:hypothetical protein [Clostridia bacterium]